MKVIDLLSKIANGEEVPKKIKLNGIIFEYQGDDYLFIEKNNDNHEYWLFSDGYTDKFQWLDNFLRTEVEIIEEEKKIPEKLDVLVEIMSSDKIGVLTNEIGEIQRRFNQLLDYLKSKGE